MDFCSKSKLPCYVVIRFSFSCSGTYLARQHTDKNYTGRIRYCLVPVCEVKRYFIKNMHAIYFKCNPKIWLGPEFGGNEKDSRAERIVWHHLKQCARCSHSLSIYGFPLPLLSTCPPPAVFSNTWPIKVMSPHRKYTANVPEQRFGISSGNTGPEGSTIKW